MPDIKKTFNNLGVDNLIRNVKQTDYKQNDSEEKRSQMLAGLDKLEKTITSDEGKALLKKVQEARKGYVDDQDQFLSLLKANKRDDAAAMLAGELRKSQTEYIKSVTDLIALQEGLVEKAGKDAEAMADAAERMLIILAAAAAALCVAIGWFLTRSIVKPTQKLSDAANRMAEGDFEFKIDIDTKDETGVLATSMRSMQVAVNTMIVDANMLSKAAVEGKLATRADASKHKGDFFKIVKGVNDTLDSVIGPLNVTADYVDKISKGVIPPVITDNYNGDFNVIKGNLNQCIDAVTLLVNDAAMLSKAAVEGRLKTRAEASKHQGDFRKIVQGVNDTLDAVIGPLNVAAEYVDRIALSLHRPDRAQR